MEVVELLGGEKVFKRRISERNEMREALREGLPYQALESLAKAMEIQISTLTKVIGVAPRTLARRKGSKTTFNPVESDRLYRVARIMSLAIEVLGSREKAKEWLSRPNRALGGDTPLSLLDTDIGAKQVEEILGRIEHGVFS
ncbi:MAG TPA: antitoxin Xre/MbcA/ParS toxin-binding domain-containing protein [Thermodesulfobacteriota bacterium]|nr:antitoxin Xre/MbcA/ParS toxin-binding domain-containing protein [Thermodesulfobacteriota bacterium]